MSGSDIKIDLPDGSSLPAYLARPATETERPAVVLLQEIFGINANMRAIADGYAARGITAIAPDLFWRQEPGIQLDPASAADRDRATKLMKGLDQTLAAEDACASAAYVASLSGSSGEVGAVGYCLGGKIAYLMATMTAVGAAVSYYGVAIQAALDRAADIRCPLLLHIAEQDHLCPPEAREAIKNALSHNPLVTIVEYPLVGHAFAREGSASYDAGAANRAGAATAEFLARYLGTTP